MDTRLYHKEWRKISYFVRFTLHKGRCQFCGISHSEAVLACIHLDRIPYNNDIDNLGCACIRCHFTYDRHENAFRKKYGRHYYINQLKINFYITDDAPTVKNEISP